MNLILMYQTHCNVFCICMLEEVVSHQCHVDVHDDFVCVCHSIYCYYDTSIKYLKVFIKEYKGI